MTRGVVLIKADKKLSEAAKKMRDLEVGSLIVESHDGVVLGVLTDRDIIVRAVAEDKDLSSTVVTEIMTPDPVSCRAEDSIERAAELFAKHKIRRLLIKDATGAVVGSVSLGDLIRNIFKVSTKSARGQRFRNRRSAARSVEQIPVH